jgi:exopolyphosphatase/guanosine-5'-triphosphate,3'-diphosphate pyrophosphatase
MIEIFCPEKIIISIYGLKEGVRVELLNNEDKLKDIVEEKVKYSCNYDLTTTSFDSYFNILKKIIDLPDEFQQTLKLAIVFLSLRRKFDRTLTSRALSEHILTAEIPFKHKTRVMLALIIVYTSHHKLDYDLFKISKKLIDKKEHSYCQIIGHFLQIAEEIDGPNFTSPTFSINVKNLYLEIEWDGILPRPVFEKVCSHLKSIAYIKKINLY